jgi:hypothetical protein
MDSNRDEMIDVTQAFVQEFRTAVGVNAPVLLSSMEAFGAFLGEWTDTLEERVLACGTADGHAYAMLVVLLNELAKCQIELSMRAGGDRPAN